MEKIKIGVLPGSLRHDSYSMMVARIVAGYLSPDFEVRMLEIGDLTMFNQDYDDNDETPLSWLRFRSDVAQMDGFMIVTPEYKRSFPPLIKNALDIASRPNGQNRWGGKPGAIISVSTGKLGAFGANHHLRQVMTLLNVYIMQQPEMYVGSVADIFDSKGILRKGGTREFLMIFADAFADWVRMFVK